MKGIILQHFEPQAVNRDPELGSETPRPWIVNKSIANIKKYAESIGAEYRLLSGEPFRPGLRAQCQKCAMINEEYDEYDVVVMLDTDKFMVKGCQENILEAKGIAPFDKIHSDMILPKFYRQFPHWASMNTPIWSGACYVMPRDFRILLRNQINPEMERMFKQVSPLPFVDEGIFHCLSVKAGVTIGPKYNLDSRWDQSSYLPNPEKAFMLHMRHKPKPRDENLKDFIAKGIIEDL
jgi:hypothetical protein